MAFAGKNVILVGMGAIGQGAAFNFLKEGARVIAIVRDTKKVDGIKSQLPNNQNLTVIVGEADSDQSAATVRDQVLAALGKDQHIDHVVIATFWKYTAANPTEGSMDQLNTMIKSGFAHVYLHGKNFLPSMKNRDHTSFTFVSARSSHGVHTPTFFELGLRAAMVNSIASGFAKETEKDKVRVNTVCIHMGVNWLGESVNALGQKGADTTDFGKVFLRVAAGNQKGQTMCLESLEQAEKI